MAQKNINLHELYSIDFNQYTQELKSKKPEHFIEEGIQGALSTFKQAAKRVPAYKDFLKNHNINPLKINTLHDFKTLPLTDKKYLRNYKLSDLCWDSKLTELDMISTSSGSTGEPFYWPRGVEQESEVTKIYELFYQTLQADKKKTLVVIGYSMGTWIAGTFTLTATMRLAQKGYPITIISPGINIEEIVKAVKNLGSYFEQIVLAGYPPFIKDVIDHGKNAGIDWSALNVKFIFGAEVISDQFRKYVLRAVGKTSRKERLTDTINTYGTADAAILGFETPLSIFIRQQATDNEKLRKELFKDSCRWPTLAQYDPRLKFFEEIEHRLVFTSSSGIPLIRYDIGDDGSIISFTDIIKILLKYKIDYKKDFKELDIQNLIWKLPFVYLFGRKDLTATIYGLNVYPENIKAALESKEIQNYVTGKFTMCTEETSKHNQCLLITIELAENVEPTENLKKLTKKIVVAKLNELNSEYHKLYNSIGVKAVPKIKLAKYEDPEYFKIKIKQRWVKKEMKGTL